MRVHQDEESLQCLSDSVTLFGIAKPAALTVTGSCTILSYNPMGILFLLEIQNPEVVV